MEVRDKIFINPQDVTDYYNKHINEFERKTQSEFTVCFCLF